MKLRKLILAGLSLAMLSVPAAQAERTRRIVAHDDVRIEVIAEGSGPPVVLLPGRGRDSLDFDELAAGIAKAGFRVLRPQPRGAGDSHGPMQNLTLHDFARDIAAVIRHEQHACRHRRARLRQLGRTHDGVRHSRTGARGGDRRRGRKGLSGLICRRQRVVRRGQEGR